MFIENKNKTQQKNLFQKRAGKNIFWLRGGIQKGATVVLQDSAANGGL